MTNELSSDERFAIRQLRHQEVERVLNREQLLRGKQLAEDLEAYHAWRDEHPGYHVHPLPPAKPQDELSCNCTECKGYYKR